MGLRSCSCLLLLLLGLLVLAAPAEAACTGTVPCVPDCTGCAKNDKTPNPRDCRGFLLCKNASSFYDTPFDCPDGQVFDVTIHDCVDGETCEPCPPACFYQCSPDVNYLSSVSFETDCTTYAPCSSGAVGPLEHCPPEAPYFDGLSCQTEESRCCHCHAYCTSDVVEGLIADPVDCRRYYACTEEGPATISGTCPDGEYFYEAINDCSSLGLCNTSPNCQNVVGLDGCIEPFTCLDPGSFAKCPSQCTPEYYTCTEATGQYTEVETCQAGTVFHPEQHTCVSEGLCPY